LLKQRLKDDDEAPEAAIRWEIARASLVRPRSRMSFESDLAHEALRTMPRRFPAVAGSVHAPCFAETHTSFLPYPSRTDRGRAGRASSAARSSDLAKVERERRGSRILAA
jgi:hypothetical protein